MNYKEKETAMYAILADIHGNMYALQKVLEDMSKFTIDGVVLLGDMIDYGMQSNEVIDCIKNDLKYNIICNIWGNHERAIMLDDFKGFSSRRGSECAQYTASILTKEIRGYIGSCMNHNGKQEFELFGKRCLAVHGSLQDNYWKPISLEDVRGDYHSYDLVFSGHSHYSHVFSKFYDTKDKNRRDKHAVMFINPGSVGQPRNHNPNAQYALIDQKMNVQLRSVEYEVFKAMETYDGHVDLFYRDRLEYGC